MNSHQSPSRGPIDPKDKEAAMKGLPSTSADREHSDSSNARELPHDSHRRRGRSSRSLQGTNTPETSPTRSSKNRHGRKGGKSSSRSPHDSEHDNSKSPRQSPPHRKNSSERRSSRSRSRRRSGDVVSGESPPGIRRGSRRKSSRPKTRRHSADVNSSSDKTSSSDRIRSSSHGRGNSPGAPSRHQSPQRKHRGTTESSNAMVGRLEGISNGSPTRNRRSNSRHRHSKSKSRSKSPRKKNRENVSSIGSTNGHTESDRGTDMKRDLAHDRDGGEKTKHTKKSSSKGHRHSRKKSKSPNNRESIASLESMVVLTESDEDSVSSERAVQPEVQNFVIGTPKKQRRHHHRRQNSSGSISSLAILSESDEETTFSDLASPEYRNEVGTKEAGKRARRSGARRSTKRRGRTASPPCDISSKQAKRKSFDDLLLSPSAATVATGMTSATTATLYGNDADAKAKAKASKGSFGPAVVPGVQQMYSASDATVATNMTSATATTLYGSDADAKAKAKAYGKSSKYASVPGVETVFSSGATSTLYGSDADAKAKAKASKGSSQYASNPGVVTVSTGSAVDTLYGKDSDAKAKAKAARGAMFAANPGAQGVAMAATMSPMAENGEFGKDLEAPIARQVSIGGTDSESGSIMDPKSGKGNKKNDGEEPKKKRRRRVGFWFCLSALLLIGGGVAVWWFLFREDGSNQNGQINASGIQNPTTTPSSQTTTLAPMGPSSSFSDAPSSPPTNVELIFQPPSKDNCEAIAKNETIVGRDELDNADFGLALEVVLSDNLNMTRPLVHELLGAIQERVLPSIAGCNIHADEFVEAWRFVILDAFVTGNAKPEETCNNKDLVGQNCHRVNVQLDVFLKGFVRFLDIIRLISDEELNIANNLELPDSFSIIQMVSIDSLTPTASPTITPTDLPSVSPTEFPTVTKSSNPTSSPSIKVTGVPTRLPTKLPTRRPTTSAPSVAPRTAVPNSDPTSLPSMSPSGVPSESPTMMPTAKGQTRAPSAEPSFSPSALPTTSIEPTALVLVPTALPSSNPSANPSSKVVGPTESPSTRPSKSPTAIPSTRPTTAPVTFPTPPPSASPTAIPSARPSVRPSRSPSSGPSSAPSATPSAAPSNSPSKSPSASPSRRPSSKPSFSPSMRPSSSPSKSPSESPSTAPSGIFTLLENNRNCPLLHPAHLDVIEGVADETECANECFHNQDCVVFAIGNNKGQKGCYLCSSGNNLQFEGGAKAYLMN